MSTKKRGRPSKEEGSAPQKKVKGAQDYSLIPNYLTIGSIRSVHVSKSGYSTSYASRAEIFTL